MTQYLTNCPICCIFSAAGVGLKKVTKNHFFKLLGLLSYFDQFLKCSTAFSSTYNYTHYTRVISGKSAAATFSSTPPPGSTACAPGAASIQATGYPAAGTVSGRKPPGPPGPPGSPRTSPAGCAPSSPPRRPRSTGCSGPTSVGIRKRIRKEKNTKDKRYRFSSARLECAFHRFIDVLSKIPSPP